MIFKMVIFFAFNRGFVQPIDCGGANRLLMAKLVLFINFWSFIGAETVLILILVKVLWSGEVATFLLHLWLTCVIALFLSVSLRADH